MSCGQVPDTLLSQHMLRRVRDLRKVHERLGLEDPGVFAQRRLRENLHDDERWRTPNMVTGRTTAQLPQAIEAAERTDAPIKLHQHHSQTERLRHELHRMLKRLGYSMRWIQDHVLWYERSLGVPQACVLADHHDTQLTRPDGLRTSSALLHALAPEECAKRRADRAWSFVWEDGADRPPRGLVWRLRADAAPSGRRWRLKVEPCQGLPPKQRRELLRELKALLGGGQ